MGVQESQFKDERKRFDKIGEIMAEWLKRVVDEVDRQFDELPEWKKASSNDVFKCSTDEERSSTIREPRRQQD
jgi:hypothetical protein